MMSQLEKKEDNSLQNINNSSNISHNNFTVKTCENFYGAKNHLKPSTYLKKFFPKDKLSKLIKLVEEDLSKY